MTADLYARDKTIARLRTRVAVLEQDAEQANAALDRVRALHRKANNGETCVYCAHGQRLGYDTTWPCDTIRTLDMQQPTTEAGHVV